MSEYFNMLLV